MASKSSSRSILLWGGSAQGRLLAELARQSGDTISYIVDPFLDRPAFDSHATFIEPSAAGQVGATHFIVAIGDGHGLARHQTHNYLCEMGLKPMDVVAASARISQSAYTGDHFQAFMGSTLGEFSSVGRCCVFNSCAVVDHECVIGDGVHIMGSAAVAGQVVIEDYVTVGTNATILPRVTVGRGAYIGAGAVVTRDVPPLSVVAGVPAKPLRENKLTNAMLPKTASS